MPNNQQYNRFFLSGGLVAAILSSACCWGPLLLVGIGGMTGTASFLSWLEPYQPYLMGVTIGALGIAFYNVYRPFQETSKAEDNCADGSCRKNSGQNRITKIVLWTVTVIALVSFSYPYYAGSLLASDQTKLPISAVDGAVDTLRIHVSGMTCQGCAQTIHHELKQKQGVLNSQVSYPEERAVIFYHPDKTTASSIQQTIANLGYETKPEPKNPTSESQ